jgi:outer membrane protein OmpA-like peptidoglycan-associated protein
LLNKPQLVEREQKIVKEEITTQRRIVSKREQVLIQKENVSFIFNDQMINFKFNSFELTEKSQQFVSGLGQIFAAQHSDWQSLTVEGHTDSKGGNEYNKRLSQRRAESVRDILVTNGVPSVSVIAVGRGEENLLVKNEQSEVDFARNRRVEIKIQGLRNARLLQRSIKRLERELFGRPMSTSGSETDESAEQEIP